MTRRRWIADEFSVARAALTGAHATHLSRTLRARVGQQFEVACGNQVRLATVSDVQDERVEFTLGEEVAAGGAVPITLLLAIFKFDRMEWAIEKCTELNVSRIVPVVTRRTERHLALAAGKRVERWRRIAHEAAEQSRRTALPEICDPVKLKEALAGWDGPSVSAARSTGDFDPVREIVGKSSYNLRIVLAEAEREASLAGVLDSCFGMSSLSLAVGPEGGWTTEELQTFAASHWMPASLGDTVLRAETAAISAVAIATAKVSNK